MYRLPQLILIVCLLASCWLGMQIVHEFGHVLGAWCTGGTVSKVVLRPWTISRTDLKSNPDPPTVAWAGPVLGAALPFTAWVFCCLLRLPSGYLLRFFAAFCLVANGLYLGVGAFDRVGDAGDIQQRGSDLWMLILFAFATVPAGLLLWHKQGQYFGFGGVGGQVKRRDIVLCVVAFCLALIIEFAVGSP